MKTSTKRSTSTSTAASSSARARSFSSHWEVDPQLFQVYLAVPSSGDMKDVRRPVKYKEHVYTVSEEDLPELTPSRGEFRACHSRCVQTSCLPVSAVTSFSQCVSSCRDSC